MNTEEKYLAQRVLCSRRDPNGQPIEQAVRSCMHAYWIANNLGQKTWSQNDSMTGLPFIEALDKCKGCPQGMNLMEVYKEKFGPIKLFSREAIKYQARKIRKLKWEENKTWPWTANAIKTEHGFPSDQ